jgi:hypothetical protein
MVEFSPEDTVYRFIKGRLYEGEELMDDQQIYSLLKYCQGILERRYSNYLKEKNGRVMPIVL